MKVLAVIGSYRKGRTIDTLADWVVEGARKTRADLQAEKIYLADLRIDYCRNCMACREDDPAKPVADCVLRDDMDRLLPKLVEADALILGTPVNMGTATAVMKTFLERACWTMARPGNGWPLKGIPTPRSGSGRRAVLLVSAGVVPPALRWFCDDATRLMKSCCGSSLGARVVGSLYAGAVEKRGAAPYRDQALKLGRRLVSP